MAVVELSASAANYVRDLDAGRYFDVLAISDDDRQRAEMYRTERQREVLRAQTGSLDEFLGPSPNSATRFNESFGVLALGLYAGGYGFEYLTPPGTPFSDSGSATCH